MLLAAAAIGANVARASAVDTGNGYQRNGMQPTSASPASASAPTSSER